MGKTRFRLRIAALVAGAAVSVVLGAPGIALAATAGGTTCCRIPPPPPCEINPQLCA
jgi:hypothetical protein